MSRIPRSRLAVITAMAAVPAVMLVSACGSSTSPKALSAADTVGVNANSVVIERYTNASDSGYYTEASQYDGDYAEAYNENAQINDYREVMQYALPALHGKHVVDSANVYEFVCDNSANNSNAVIIGLRPTAAAKHLAARRAAVGHALGAAAAPSVMLDHIYFAGSYTDSTAWGADLMGASTTLIAASDVSVGWKTASVTSDVQADYAAGNANSQYRIRYSANPGGEYFVDFGGIYCDDPAASGASGGSYLVIWSH